MTVDQNTLKEQLLDYRKASRALMWYYDSSNKLYGLITEALAKMGLTADYISFEDEEAEDWDRPTRVSSEAFVAVKTGQNDWCIKSGSDADYKMKRNSFCFKIYLALDNWPANDPNESLSTLEIYGWHVKNITGKATDCYDEFTDTFNAEMINEDSGIDSNGDMSGPMKLTAFPDLWSAGDGKYKGDYAVGMYDLSELVGEEAVRDTVITDIEKLIGEWSKS
jgi:hypothetical protein